MPDRNGWWDFPPLDPPLERLACAAYWLQECTPCWEVILAWNLGIAGLMSAASASDGRR